MQTTSVKFKYLLHNFIYKQNKISKKNNIKNTLKTGKNENSIHLMQ